MVNGLKLMDDKLPKLRLCMNRVYVQFYMRYLPLQYENFNSLVDIMCSKAHL